MFGQISFFSCWSEGRQDVTLTPYPSLRLKDLSYPSRVRIMVLGFNVRKTSYGNSVALSYFSASIVDCHLCKNGNVPFNLEEAG